MQRQQLEAAIRLLQQARTKLTTARRRVNNKIPYKLDRPGKLGNVELVDLRDLRETGPKQEAPARLVTEASANQPSGPNFAGLVFETCRCNRSCSAMFQKEEAQR